jgi:hypothetical protein
VILSGSDQRYIFYLVVARVTFYLVVPRIEYIIAAVASEREASERGSRPNLYVYGYIQLIQ